ncbi:MAG: type II 3-dehydroquinate dehydratase [Acidimicrobiales bacterium]
MSNPDAREPWRRTSVVAPVATGTISGFGGDRYRLALGRGGPAPGMTAAFVPLLVTGRLDRVRASGRVRRRRRWWSPT